MTNDDDFQVHTNTPSSTNNNNNKRVYIGGLPKNHPNLQQELVVFLNEQLPDLSIVSITLNNGGKAPHALVDCGSQANTVISKLHQQVWQGKKLVVQREKRQGKKKQSTTNTNNTNFIPQQQKSLYGWSKPTPIPIDAATEQIQSVILNEIQQAEENGDDLINVALASTAAVAMLASMNAFGADDYDDQEETTWLEDNDNTNGASSFQIKDMSDLLADFGAEDPNWQKMQITTPEVVEPTESRLGQEGKAPIHIVLASFGYRNGSPPRPMGGSQSQPLSPLDVQELFEVVPEHMEWRDGQSGAVKQALRNSPSDTCNIEDFAKETFAKQVWDCLLEAQNTAGYGYASPLKMTFYVGSDLGRHRSVVICEWAAMGMRQLLRKNADNAIHQPVSVGTFHRDIEKKHKSDKVKNNNTHNIRPQHTGSKKKHDFGADW